MLGVLNWLTAHWTLIAPLFLGAVSIIFLMPRAGKEPRARLGMLLGFLALTWAVYGVFRLSLPDYFLYNLMFVAFAVIAVACAVGMITHRNPVYSALFFALVILSSCGLFLLQSASFLAAATIIVYAGAIIVTFLFITMLAQQSGLADYDKRSREPVLATIGGVVLIASIFCAIQANFNKEDSLQQVQTALNEAIDLAEPDRAVQSMADIKEKLNLSPKHAQSLLKASISRLTAWPNYAATDVQLDQLWEKLFQSMASKDMPQTRAGLVQIYNIVGSLIDAEGRVGGLIAPADSVKKNMSTLSKRDGTNYVVILGRSLFGDYLYAVEQAGTLLLVATLAAILIAGKKKETVR